MAAPGDGLRRRTVAANGLEVSLLEAGEGPLVVLCHGFPELAYSWRHQLHDLAAAGYHAVAPDMRGYGRTTAPPAVEDYDIEHLSGDVLGVLDALGRERAVLVGHDWGSPVVWHTALRHPERLDGVVGMSVPFVPRPLSPPLGIFERLFADTWFYILYFQAPGVADADLARDPATFQRRILCAISGEGVAGAGAMAGGGRDGRGMVDRLPEPDALPAWLEEADVERYAAEFTRTGYTGALNWYRNMDRNWALTADLAGARVTVPAAFVAGALDPVLLMSPPDRMADHLDDLRAVTLVEGAGHWVQQERPAEVNTALRSFLAGVHG